MWRYMSPYALSGLVTRLLILRFLFSYKLGRERFFAYSFSDLTLVYVFTLLLLLYSALQDVWRRGPGGSPRRRPLTRGGELETFGTEIVQSKRQQGEEMGDSRKKLAEVRETD